MNWLRCCVSREEIKLSSCIRCSCVSSVAPVQESPTIYSAFLQENQKDKTSEKEAESALRSSSSTGSLVSAAGKKNTQQTLNKKASEKKKDTQFTLEDALQQVVVGSDATFI